MRVQRRTNQPKLNANSPLLASAQGGVAERSRNAAKHPLIAKPGWFSDINQRKTTPASSDSMAARHFINDAATPPSGDARKGLRRGGMWLLIAMLCLVVQQPAGVASNQPAIVALDSIGLTVSDVDRSVDFFSKVLSFEKVSDTEIFGSEYEHLQGLFGMRARVVRMKLGDESIELTEYLTPKGRLIPVDSRSNDRWFQHIAIIVSDMDKAYQWLLQNKVEYASTGPQTLPEWNKNAAGIKAFYFKDPDQHALEILWFPPGKGEAKWHRDTNALFLGIDHTAIVINDTNSSLQFYRDSLGLKQVGESENYGVEQEHLNNVFGARLRITALRAASGPGVEFLEYIAPRDGRPYPNDARANDLFHWQTNFISNDVSDVETGLRAGRSAFISPGTVQLSDPEAQFRQALLVRDPDGHALRVAQKQ
jgi:catechol 2,3-dioxygenase-like lactoylglutathione lyase family enzyme